MTDDTLIKIADVLEEVMSIVLSCYLIMDVDVINATIGKQNYFTVYFFLVLVDII